MKPTSNPAVIHRCFDTLGAEVEATWRRQDYDERVFGDIAVAALARHRLPRRITPAGVLELVSGDRPMPPQLIERIEFGEPPITVYQTSRFQIDVLFWMDGTTSIHGHAFSGAFQVLAGSSVHGVYGFRGRRVSAGFELGELRLRDMELLRLGDVRPIVGGHAVIHSLFHLDRPSTTLVVRTRREVQFEPQLTFLPPGVAYNYDPQDDRAWRRAQALAALRVVDEPRYWRWLSRHAHTLELHGLFLVLQQSYQLDDGARMRICLAAARRRRGEAVDLMLAALDRARAIRWIVSLRQQVHDPALRYFLAVLMNAPGRKQVLSLLRAREPRCDPRRVFASHLRALSKLRDGTGHPLVGWESDEDADQLVRLILEERAWSRVLRALRTRYEGVDAQLTELRAFHDHLMRHPLLAAWWRP